MRADRDQDDARPHASAGREPHRLRVLDHGADIGDVHAGLFQIGAVDALEAGDLGVLVLDQRRPVEARLAHGPAETGRVLELVPEAAGIDHQLLRHAAADHAGAAEAVLLGEHHLGAVARRDAGGPHAAGASADDEKIHVKRAHASPSLLPSPAPGASLRRS